MKRHRGRQSRGAPDSSAAASPWVVGVHPVAALLVRAPERVIELVFADTRHDARMAALVADGEAAGVAIRTMAADALQALADGAAHQGVAARVSPVVPLDESALLDHVDALTGPPLLLVLDGVQDPRNLGACLRVADGAGVNVVVVPARRAAPLTTAAVKAASGAAALMPIARVTNLARTLRALSDRDIRLVGTSGEATTSLYAADLSGPLALVMGGEAGGLRRLTGECCDLMVALPMRGVAESLNVSVATGICLYEALRQRGTAA